MYRLRDAGFIAYLVGGGVRDLYLGKKPKDFDISTDARPGQLKQIFRNSRIIGKRFRLVQVFFHNNRIIEVSTFRRRNEYDLSAEDQLLASDNTFGTPADDAFRRDLTINSLFYSIEDFSIIDYTGGVDDLKNGVIRIIGDPERRIMRDPVRMMRAIRHAARSDFTIEGATWEAIRANAAMLRQCPVSRIRDEIFKDLRGGASRSWVDLAIESGLFGVLFPFYQHTIKELQDRSELAQSFYSQFQVIDRVCGDGPTVPDAVLLGLILIPWAMEQLDLMKKRKGRDLFAFSRQLRGCLDSAFVHLNIKRADKESITNLLTQLPIMEYYDNGNNLPAKLRRKSYFAEVSNFYKLYLESKGGSEAEELEFSSQPGQARKSRRRSSRYPAFARKTKGGIFGFKR